MLQEVAFPSQFHPAILFCRSHIVAFTLDNKGEMLGLNKWMFVLYSTI